MPPNCLYGKMLCTAHIVHLIIDETNQLVGDVYAMELVCRVPRHRNTLLANLRSYLQKHMRIVNDGRAPRPEDMRNVDAILEYTVRRHYRHIRARLASSNDPELALQPGKGEAEGEEACRRLRLVFNGDPSLPHPCHIRTHETKTMSDDEIIDLALDALVRARVIPGLSSMLPSKSRWGSMMTALERQAGGFLLNNILGHVANETFRRWGSADATDEADDFRAVLRRKGWRVKCFTESEARRRTACITLVCSLPLDHLWRRLQHVEEHGAALQDLAYKKTNFFNIAAEGFCAMASAAVSEGPMACVLHHFGGVDRERHAAVRAEMRQFLLSRAAHLWYRLQVPMNSFPWKLCALTDVRISHEEKLAIAREFYSKPLCCLDGAFSQKAQRAMNDHDTDMLSACTCAYRVSLPPYGRHGWALSLHGAALWFCQFVGF